MSFGSPPPNYDGPAGSTARRDATISLVAGIIGLFFLGLIAGVVAIVFGQRARRAGAGGMATAGFVLGIVDVVLWLVGLIAFSSNGFFSF